MRSTPRVAAARAVAGALAGLALSSCSAAPATGPSVGPSPAPTPTPTPVTLTVDSGTSPLRLRHVPATAGNELAKIPTGASIVVDCSVTGQTVAGTQGSTALWHHVTFQDKSGFVSAAYVAGSKGAAIPECAVVPAIATTPRPAPSASTTAGTDPGPAVIALAQSQVGVAEKGKNCNPYAKACEEWCGHFASWVWRRAGIEVPVFPFTGDFYAWGKTNGRTHDGVAGVAPGDLVLYGTGPQSTKTSTHVDIVVEVHPDRLRVVGGNVSDRVTERDVPLTGIYAYVAVRG